jgi:diguanylate cyclase (GGDEF)-like protein/PAS domain S-box-containing protein
MTVKPCLAPRQRPPVFSGITSMLARIYSFKLIVCLILLWLTLLAYGLAIYSSRVYRNLALENQVESLLSVIELETQEAIDFLFDKQSRFVFNLQKESDFLEALNDTDRNHLKSWLDQSFYRYIDNTENLRLKALIVRDLKGEIIAQVGDSSLRPYSGCRQVLANIKSAGFKGRGPERALCSFENELYTEMLVAVGGTPQAYIHVIAYTIEELKNLERELDMPLQITTASGSLLFRSPGWTETGREYQLRPQYQLFGDDSVLGANIAGSSNQRVFLQQLETTQTRFLMVTTLATVLTLMLVVYLLRRAFKPLGTLRNSVGALLTGKFAPISEDKLPNELLDLVQAYNEMIEGLEIETISRRQMEERLRSEKDFISTTLDSITNPVIAIDSQGSIKLINPGAEKLIGDKEINLIGQSIHQVLILYSNRQTTHIVDIKELLSRGKILNSMFFYDSSRNIIELEFSASTMIDLETEDVGHVIILKDVSEDRKLRRKLSYEGSHDQLTGFLNRAAFEEKFEILVIEDHNEEALHILAQLDIDQFKVVNETCGNAAGDLLLKQVGSIIKKHVRKSEIISRLGADEFGFIMPFYKMDRAVQVMQKIIIEIQQTGFEWYEKEYQVTASIGAMAFGRVNDEYPEFFSKVNTACFLAKRNGGNQYHFIDDNDEKVIAQQESMDWVAGIMKGFTEDRFCLFVQPIISMEGDDECSHYEVLIRYRGPDGTIVSPNDFLPSAERYNLIEKIDCWVVSKVIQWLDDNEEAAANIMFSINLSGRSIGSQTFHSFLRESLQQTDVDKSALCFEITETAVVHNVENSIEFIKSIKKLGVKFSLDDFGTGLSSFSYLKQFPVDYLKIDGEFIRDIIEDDKSFVFVRSMAEVGHCLNMEVIAEFVESDTMFGKLREANIDYIQGYYVGEPVEIQTLESNSTQVRKKKASK